MFLPIFVRDKNSSSISGHSTYSLMRGYEEATLPSISAISPSGQSLHKGQETIGLSSSFKLTILGSTRQFSGTAVSLLFLKSRCSKDLGSTRAALNKLFTAKNFSSLEGSRGIVP